MNKPEISEEEKGTARSSLQGVLKLGCLSVLALFIFFFILANFGPGLIEPPLYLVFGWIGFLRRTVPNISWNWDIIGMGLLCVALILYLAHRFLGWLSAHIATTRGVAWRWPWKWTWCGLCAVMVFFLVGMAVGGIAHQTGWIISSPAPWFEVLGRDARYLNEMRMISTAFQETLGEAKGDPEVVRHKMWSFENEYFSKRDGNLSWFERYQILFILQEDKKVVGLIVFPRDPHICLYSGGLYVAGEKEDFIGAGKIPVLVQTNRQNLVSF